MNYRNLVDSSSERFDGIDRLKMAGDLAAVLDDELFAISLDDDNWGAQVIVEERKLAFNIFCALCLKAGVEVPSLEESFFKAYLPREDESDRGKKLREKTSKVAEYVRSRFNGDDSEEARLCLALVEALSVFPQEARRIEVIAVINENLVSKGLDPVRPDYSKIEVKSPDLSDPGRPVKAVVVDDCIEEILRTRVGLAGASSLEVLNYLYEPISTSWGSSLRGEEKDTRLSEVADAVIKLDPDIVILDKSMGDIEGPDLVPVLRERKPGIRIIASTGGALEDFERYGLRENFKKGNNLRPLRRILSSI